MHVYGEVVEGQLEGNFNLVDLTNLAFPNQANKSQAWLDIGSYGIPYIQLLDWNAHAIMSLKRRGRANNKLLFS